MLISSLLLVYFSCTTMVEEKQTDTGEDTGGNDLHYDYAKIHQSLMGYDFILNNIEINDNYLSRLRNCFFRKCNVKNINLLTASLYFSLLPLHEYDKDKFDRYINIIEDLT